MTWQLNLSPDRPVIALVNGEEYRESNEISLYDGEAALVEIFVPDADNQPVCIFKKILIGSGIEPEQLEF